jgi:hypothetical protein
MLIAALLFAANAASGAKAEEPKREHIVAPATNCAFGEPEILISPMADKRNALRTVARYELVKPWTGSYNFGPAIEELRAQDFQVNYTVERVAFGPTIFLYVKDLRVAADRPALNIRLARMCESIMPYGFKVIRGNIHTESESVSMELKERESDLIFLPGEAPEDTDIDKFLKLHWGGYSDEYFSSSDTSFYRVHDSICKFMTDQTGNYYSCNVGVLGLSKGAPLYEQRTLYFEWGPSIMYERELLAHSTAIPIIN